MQPFLAEALWRRMEESADYWRDPHFAGINIYPLTASETFHKHICHIHHVFQKQHRFSDNTEVADSDVQPADVLIKHY